MSHTFEGPDCWDQARAHLYRQSSTFPAQGGSDKHDFSVTFSDGYVWNGCLCCKHHSCEDNGLDVQRHVRQFAQYYAGRRRPVHVAREDYRRAVDLNPEARDAMVEFLGAYEVGVPRWAA